MTGGLLVTLGEDVAVDRLGPYSAALPPIYAAHGGRYLALGGPGRGCLALGGAPPRSVVVARFPSLEAVRAFWDSPAYAAAKPLRAGCGRFDVFAMAQCGPAAASGALTILLGGDATVPAPLLADSDDRLEQLEGAPPPARLRLVAGQLAIGDALDRWFAARGSQGYRLRLLEGRLA